jgi:deoxyribodipyrimidine photo-lyase
MDVYDQAQDELNNFINKNLSSYSKERNYDYGPDKRNNVSVLSKYVSHRILVEYDIVNTALSKYPISKIDKYVQEVFWRVYWKGWLEHRPQVWDDYYNYQPKEINTHKLNKAIEGNTGIDCFDSWVSELTNNNYLHNHTRMWFASIWIFTLKLPWQLGANFFMEHLLDGDSASNTLSWRWVAGLQTVGKHYLATSSNIKKFTNGKYSANGLDEYADPIKEDITYSPIDLNIVKSKPSSSKLIIFDNDLSIKDRKSVYNNYENIYLIHISNQSRNIKLSDNVLKFKYLCLNDCKKNFNQAEIINETNLNQILANSEEIDVIYPCIGENYSFIERYRSQTKINYIYREEDLFCWKFSKKGFFNFKKNIPVIIDKVIRTKDLFLKD